MSVKTYSRPNGVKMTVYKCTHPVQCPTCKKTDVCGLLVCERQSHFQQHEEHPWTDDYADYFEIVEEDKK